MAELTRFIEDYYRQFVDVIERFDKQPLEEIAQVLLRIAESGGTLWVAGNGGSAAIADHTVCDTTKWTYIEGQPPIRCISLSANGPMLTALGNDLEYEQVFSEQLRYYLGPDDAVLVVSSSGLSPNVIRACRFARERGVTTIAFVGFDGGELGGLADHVVHVPVDNYGMAEDVHQSVMHALTQYLRSLAEEAAGKASPS